MRQFVIVLASAGLAACGQSGQNEAANQAAAAPPEERTPYCFFRDEEAKGWSASTDKAGNVVVKGKLFRQDTRYKAALEKPRVEGTTAEVWPTVTQNDTGYGAPANWWDVKLTVPDSAAVQKVSVRCGAKTFANLDVPRKN